MTGQPSPTPAPAPRGRPAPGVAELFRSAAWLGLLGFGGGVSVLGQIGHLAVRRRGWVTEREFDSTATMAQMLPGGAAASALAHLGLRLRGTAGALAAYAGFILPGAALNVALAWAYVRFGVAPGAAMVLAGLNAAVVGVIAALALRMVRSAIARPWQMGVAALALLLSLAGGAGSGEVAALGVGAGLVVDLLLKRARLLRVRRLPHAAGPAVALPDEGEPMPASPLDRDGDGDRALPRGPPALPALLPFGWAGKLGVVGVLLPLGLLFFRAGLGAYGGGFAVVPSLHAAAVQGGFITEQQFAAAVAVGKLTPGPVLLMATFIGYVVHGLPGALVATVGIFAAPFALVTVLGGWLLRMRHSRVVRAALRGLTPAVVGLMGAAALTLGFTLNGPVEAALAAVTFLTLARFEVNPAALLAAAGAARWLLALAGI